MLIRTIDRALDNVREAFYLARTERRRVVLSVVARSAEGSVTVSAGLHAVDRLVAAPAGGDARSGADRRGRIGELGGRAAGGHPQARGASGRLWRAAVVVRLWVGARVSIGATLSVHTVSGRGCSRRRSRCGTRRRSLFSGIGSRRPFYRLCFPSSTPVVEIAILQIRSAPATSQTGCSTRRCEGKNDCCRIALGHCVDLFGLGHRWRI